MKRFLTALTLAALATTAPAFAATSLSDLVDRPTVTDAALTLAPNTVLVEAGYDNLSYKGIGSVATYPQISAKIGTEFKNLELDVVAPSEQRKSVSGSTVTGGTNIAAGLKYLILHAKRYAVSGELGVQIPTGTIGFPGVYTKTQTSVAVDANYKINKTFTVKTTQRFTAQSIPGDRYGSYTPSYALSAALPYKTNVFAEYASFGRFTGPATKSARFFQVGANHELSSNLIIDVEAGRYASYTDTGSGYSLPKGTQIGFGAAYKL